MISTPKQQEWIQKAAEVARLATCSRAKCGAVIVATDDTLIGQGYNSPPGNLESQRRCMALKDDLHKKVTDKTCCVHAEQRAVMDALCRYPDKLPGSSIYFVRLEDNQPRTENMPYCTVCSKMVLDAGITYFYLLQHDGLHQYDTEEYNLLSYAYAG